MKKLSTLLVLLILLPAFSACDEDNSERNRSAVYVSAVNEGGVFVCGMLDAGADKEAFTDDDFVPAGHILVTVKNRAYDPFITAPDYTPFGDFHITNVRVEWEAANADTPIDQLTPYNYDGGYDIVIPKDTEVSFGVLLVSFGMKEQPFFNGLISGATAPFTAVANMTFTGHDSGEEDEVTFEGSCIVEFIGVIVGE